MAKNIFVNLPVKDIERPKEFFTKLGFSFIEQFTDDKAVCLIIGENIYSMLLPDKFFKSFTTRRIVKNYENKKIYLFEFKK